ncbi:MAG: hypothetical protein RLZZ437_3276 [Pseudomonadota bacterium]|jgi:hypothetical protein
MTAQHFEFAGRLSRIEAGQGSFKSTLLVGPEDMHQVTYRQRGQKSKQKSRFGALGRLVTAGTAVALAVLADMGAQIGIHMANLGAPTPETLDVFLAVQFAVAMIMSTLLGMVFSLRIHDFMVLRMAAILGSMFALHNLVHMYPEPFQQFAPGGWAQMVLSTTASDTLIVRGVTYVF